MIIGLFGLSGSGKSTISMDFQIHYPNFYCTSASRILSKINRPTLKKDLTTSSLNYNQNLLIHELNKISSIYDNIFIELHAIIEDKDGNKYTVDEKLLKSLNLDYIFMIDLPAKKILEQRTLDLNKTRNFITLSKIIELEKIQKEYLIKVFSNKVEFIKDFNDIDQYMKKLIKFS